MRSELRAVNKVAKRHAKQIEQRIWRQQTEKENPPGYPRDI